MQPHGWIIQTLLSERNQTQKTIFCMRFHVDEVQDQAKLIGDGRSQNSGYF